MSVQVVVEQDFEGYSLPVANYTVVDGLAASSIESDFTRYKSQNGILVDRHFLRNLDVWKDKFGGLVIGEGRYFPWDGEKFLLALLLTHTGYYVTTKRVEDKNG